MAARGPGRTSTRGGVQAARRIGAVLLLGGAAPLVPAAPARAAACAPADAGVTVVVDFGRLGGGIQVRCVPGDPPSGLAALQRTGFAVAGTQRWGAAFVCRIDGKPGPAADRCVDTPPAAASWAYWHGSRAGWTYSTVAAASYDPEPGAVEGWAFGDGPRPGIAPPVAAAPPSAAAPSAPSETAPSAEPSAAPAARTGGGLASWLGGAALVAAIAAAALWAVRRRSR